MLASTSSFAVLAAICIVAAPFLCGIIHMICKTIENVSLQRAEANLKLEMIRKGFSANEIERVCQTKFDPKAFQNSDWTPIAPAKPAKV